MSCGWNRCRPERDRSRDDEVNSQCQNRPEWAGVGAGFWFQPGRSQFKLKKSSWLNGWNQACLLLVWGRNLLQQQLILNRFDTYALWERMVQSLLAKHPDRMYLLSIVFTCILNVLISRVESLPSVSALKFNGSLGMAVGTTTGQVDYFKKWSPCSNSVMAYCQCLHDLIVYRLKRVICNELFCVPVWCYLRHLLKCKINVHCE